MPLSAIFVSVRLLLGVLLLSVVGEQACSPTTLPAWHRGLPGSTIYTAIEESIFDDTGYRYPSG